MLKPLSVIRHPLLSRRQPWSYEVAAIRVDKGKPEQRWPDKREAEGKRAPEDPRESKLGDEEERKMFWHEWTGVFLTEIGIQEFSLRYIELTHLWSTWMGTVDSGIFESKERFGMVLNMRESLA